MTLLAKLTEIHALSLDGEIRDVSGNMDALMADVERQSEQPTSLASIKILRDDIHELTFDRNQLAEENERLRADSEMLEWLLPIIIDDDSNCLSFDRAGALMCAKLEGKAGREIVAAAMKGTP